MPQFSILLRCDRVHEVASSPANVDVSAAAGARALFDRVSRALHSEMGLLMAEPRQVLVQMASAPLPQLTFNRVRTALLRAGGMKIGRGSQIMGSVTVTGPGRWSELLEIGEQTFLTGPIRIDLAERITIGDHVNIGHACTLLTTDHEIGPSDQRCGYRDVGPIVIEDGVWLGANVTVLPGVRIGRASVVAAGAVVARDVEPNTLVGGVPARLIRELPPESVNSRRRKTERYPLHLSR